MISSRKLIRRTQYRRSRFLCSLKAAEQPQTRHHDDRARHHQDAGCGQAGAPGQPADAVTPEDPAGQSSQPEAAVASEEQVLEADGAACSCRLLPEFAHPGAGRQGRGWLVGRAPL